MELLLQGESKGIVYEGYDKEWIQCIFEEGGVQGKNERYEFRCDAKFQCCGRACCIPEEATIPLWLMIIFVILALLLLLAILGTLAWLCAKRLKNRPKKHTGNAYSALKTNESGKARNVMVHEQDTYSTPEPVYSGYNRAYSQSGSGRGGGAAGTGYRNGYGYGHGYGNDYRNGIDSSHRELALIDEQRRAREMLNANRGRRDSRATVSSDGSVVRHGVHETFEESYKQEITYERPASTDSNML